MNEMKIECFIPDVAESKVGESKIAISFDRSGISIHPEGMGVNGDNYAPILIERHNGNIRLIYWPNINEEEPVIVDMFHAKVNQNG